MRIAFGGIHIECSTYSPLRTMADDFRTARGAALLDDPAFGFLRDYDATFLPTLHARAIPGGPVARPDYEALKAEFLERLSAALPLDGLYLAMHGAMFVDGMEDCEGDWFHAARAVVGPDCLVSASYDLHGNLTTRIIDALDMYSTYRTAPHIDVEQTMRRSVSMLVHSLASGIRPGIVWAPVPVVLPGERTSTVDEPAKSLYGLLPALDGLPGIWDASLMVGYVWADEPRATAAVVLTGTDRTILEREALQLAQAYWDAREAFSFGCITDDVDGCVRRALDYATHPVVIADSGDNPTAGGVGDRADLLAALIRHDAPDVLIAAITDPAATSAAYQAGPGSWIDVFVGAALDPAGSVPVRVRAEVIHLHATNDALDQEAVVRVGGISLVLAARRRPYHHLADFARLGLDPAKFRILVVKSGYLSPDLAAIAQPNLMALSPGVVDQFVERLPRLRKAHPTFPFDRDFSWNPQVLSSARARFDTHPAP